MVESPQNMPPPKVDVCGVFSCMQCGGCFRKVAGMVCHCAWTGGGCLKVEVRPPKMWIMKAFPRTVRGESSRIQCMFLKDAGCPYPLKNPSEVLPLLPTRFCTLLATALFLDVPLFLFEDLPSASFFILCIKISPPHEHSPHSRSYTCWILLFSLAKTSFRNLLTGLVLHFPKNHSPFGEFPEYNATSHKRPVDSTSLERTPHQSGESYQYLSFFLCQTPLVIFLPKLKIIRFNKWIKGVLENYKIKIIKK